MALPKCALAAHALVLRCLPVKSAAASLFRRQPAAASEAKSILEALWQVAAASRRMRRALSRFRNTRVAVMTAATVPAPHDLPHAVLLATTRVGGAARPGPGGTPIDPGRPAAERAPAWGPTAPLEAKCPLAPVSSAPLAYHMCVEAESPLGLQAPPLVTQEYGSGPPCLPLSGEQVAAGSRTPTDGRQLIQSRPKVQAAASPMAERTS